MRSKLLYVVLLIVCCMPVWSQIPSNPIAVDSIGEQKQNDHRPGSGFLIANGKKATLTISPYVTIRYLNQGALDDTYTNHLGHTSTIDKRNDLQFQKAVIYFKGWLIDPKFRYLLYVWSANANQGQGAQVVVAGNLQYEINKHFDIGAGIGSLPTSRSLIGNWPFWLRQDARPMAEEFFRGSFTTGIWAQGEITDGLYYKTMLGNNLSQLGVDAGQLDNGFNTFSTSVWWTTNNYGRVANFGDFERHEKLATLLGGAYTTSKETRQSQPGTEDPENSQIRLSDGTGVFSLDAFGNGNQLLSAKYQMTSFNGGLKYKGLSLDLEYYIRWVNDFESTGPLPVKELFDSGYALQASGMLINKTLQLYSTYSYIDGEYGKPWELTCGLNWYVLKNRVLRINPEVLYVENSPVGYLSYPTVVGANGIVGMLNLELFF
ncbi:hypothetical protein SAMN05444397_101952 [Flavobacterium aquidurense]|uniref:hypothetical protein n=1 Tax=Flavobacterium frigidimaris TaxID=262320 RepID=UPI000894B277|nr:hypothetical protein [Flavobacterium frigidimaris]SDY56488.1 hypothetical protein SAMN05444397_101952 [Flavobacterium aquidurense]